jgi:hypothetical protein
MEKGLLDFLTGRIPVSQPGVGQKIAKSNVSVPSRFIARTEGCDP